MEELIRERERALADPAAPSTRFSEHAGCGTVRTEAFEEARHAFGLPESFTKEQVHDVYLRRLLVCHPDRPPGTRAKFNQLKASYKLLRAAVTRPVVSVAQMLHERDAGLAIPKVNVRNFNAEFESVHTGENAAVGHDEWFTRDVPAEARAPETVRFKDFHKRFEQANRAKASAIVRHVVRDVPSSNMQCAELGGDTCSVFHGAGYSDLKQAYGESILN
jgi:hypothetical protein